MFRNLLLIAVMAGVASAATITPGNNPTGIEYNTLLAGGATGTTVTGTAGGALVNFQSTQTLTNPSNGQARTETLSGNLLTNITFGPALPGITFGDVIFNAFCRGASAGCASSIGISVDGSAVQTFSLTNGQNFFTVVGSNLSSVSLSGTGFTDLRQVRFSDLSGIPPTGGVPEPGTIGMLATGLGAILFGIRRKQRA